MNGKKQENYQDPLLAASISVAIQVDSTLLLTLVSCTQRVNHIVVFVNNHTGFAKSLIAI